MNMQPSILENIQENYNLRTSSANGEMAYDNDRYKYGVSNGHVDMDGESLYGSRKKDYQDNYGEYDTNGSMYMQQQQQQQHHHQQQQHQQTPSHYGSEKDYSTSTQIVNQMRAYPNVAQHENVYHIYDKQRPTYLGSKIESPYMSKERIHTDMYSPRDNHYVLKSPPIYCGGPGESMNSVHSMLKNDYQVCLSRQYFLSYYLFIIILAKSYGLPFGSNVREF